MAPVTMRQESPRPVSANGPVRANHNITAARPNSAVAYRGAQKATDVKLPRTMAYSTAMTTLNKTRCETPPKANGRCDTPSTVAPSPRATPTPDAVVGRRPSSSASWSRGIARQKTAELIAAAPPKDLEVVSSMSIEQKRASQQRELLLMGEGSHTGVRPASPSMFESALHQGEQFSSPFSQGLADTQSALEKDAARFAKKYAQPTNPTYQVSAPTSPNHRKFCHRELEGLMDVKGKKYPLGVAFNEKSLREMFKMLDEDNSGSISHRELIVGLRRNKQLLSMFQLMRRKPHSDGASMMERFSIITNETPAEARARAIKEEVYWIKEILREVDLDFSRTMEWPEFLEFFRAAGLLLEVPKQDGLQNGVDAMTGHWSDFKVDRTETELVRLCDEEAEKRDEAHMSGVPLHRHATDVI